MKPLAIVGIVGGIGLVTVAVLVGKKELPKMQAKKSTGIDALQAIYTGNPLKLRDVGTAFVKKGDAVILTWKDKEKLEFNLIQGGTVDAKPGIIIPVSQLWNIVPFVKTDTKIPAKPQ